MEVRLQKTPDTFRELSQVNFKKQIFLDNRKKLFSEAKSEYEIKPRLPETPLTPNKSSFLFTTIVHIYMFTGSTLGILWALPYVWYAIKLSTLVGAMAMYKASPAEGRPINVTQEWTHRLTAPYRHGPLKRYVPFKIGQFVGSPFLFEYNSCPQVNQLTLQKQLLWDHIDIAWQNKKVFYKNNRIPLKEHITVPLKDKIRFRNIFRSPFYIMLMVKQGDTWYNLKHKTNEQCQNLSFSDAHPSSKEVNGFWFKSSQGMQLLKLAMGEKALSASCTVRTPDGVHYLTYNRWGDSKQRSVPYRGGHRPGGRKSELEMERYQKDKARERSVKMYGEITRNPSPPGNPRARSMIAGSAPRRELYTPQIEPVSDEDSRRYLSGPPGAVYRRGRRYPVRAFKRDGRGAPSSSEGKRCRTPSPESWPHNKRRSSTHHLKSATLFSPPVDSETDSTPEAEGKYTPDSYCYVVVNYSSSSTQLSSNKCQN